MGQLFQFQLQVIQRDLLTVRSAERRHPAINGAADEVARLSYEMADAMLKAREGE